MKIFIAIIWFFIFTKLLIFWVWLWQLKEYHWGRFKAHFETQKIRKIIFSFHGPRYPKLTKKTIVILVSGALIEFLFLFFIFNLTNYLFYIFLLISIILTPIIVSLLILLFQIPANILIKRILRKAREKREQFSARGGLVIGITGSYGKSSTKEFLAEILSEKATLRGDAKGVSKVLKTKKNINAEIGIAQTILKELGSFHQVLIAEIGAYERGKIKEVCQMLQPKIGILTGINEQHLSTFGSQDNIIKAKYELIESLPSTGAAIFNGVNLYCSKLYKKTKIPKKLSNGNLEGTLVAVILWPDIWAENVRVEKEFVLFRARAKDGDSADFKVNLLGRQNVENVLLAVCCAKELGMSLAEISQACQKIKPEQGAMKFLKKDGLTILDASYSANPVGVIADLDYLKIYSGKKIIVMPCLIELGKASKKVHKRIGRKINEVCDLAIITTKDYFKEIKQEAPNTLLIENPKEIVVKLKEFCKDEDVVLFEGRVPKEVIELLNQ